MYPELGHRPINRLGVSNRAYFLERSVPYLASALTAGVVGLGPLLASMPRLRGKRSRSYSVSDMYSATPMPTPIPTPANISSIPSTITGDTQLISDPVGTDAKRIILVGSDTDRNFSAKIYMGATRGWGFRANSYRKSLLFNNKMTLIAGDIFTTGVADSNKPTHIVGEDINVLTSVLNRNFDDTNCTVEKLNTKDYSGLKVKGSYSNMSTHFCFPIGLFKQYGGNSAGVRLTPFGLDDLFQTYSGYTLTESAAQQQPHQETTGATNSRLWGYDPVSVNKASDTGLFFSMQMEFVLYNPKDYSQTFELYYLTPKKDTQNSPLCDYHFAHSLGVEQTLTNNGSSYAHLHPNAKLFRLKHMRDTWRCISKRKLQVAGKGSVKVIFRIPLSLMCYNKLMSVTRGNETSLAGLTGWLYIKNYGLFGLDDQGNEDGAPGVESNTMGLGFSQTEYVIKGEHKVTILRQHKGHFPFMDQRYFSTEGSSSTNFTENDENDSITI